jgi:hypothetical protein
MGKAGMNKQEVMDAFRVVLPAFMKNTKVENPYDAEEECSTSSAQTTKMLTKMSRAGLNTQEMQKLFDESTSGICIEDYMHIFCRNIELGD